jgi:prophage antirepressor-like protein
MNQLTQNFNGLNIRIIHQENGELWFVCKDLCDALDIKNSRDAYMRLDEDERKESVLPTFRDSTQVRKMNIVSESGMYKIIFQSNKPNAKIFTNWVTKEVLPSIRKTGSYRTVAPQSEITRGVRYDNGVYDQVMFDVMAMPTQEGRVRLMRNIKELMFSCLPVS